MRDSPSRFGKDSFVITPSASPIPHLVNGRPRLLSDSNGNKLSLPSTAKKHMRKHLVVGLVLLLLPLIAYAQTLETSWQFTGSMNTRGNNILRHSYPTAVFWLRADLRVST